jgi:hypothetical protein
MADAMSLEAPAVVDVPPAGETGKPPGGNAPSRPKLYDQLSEPGKKTFDAARFGKLEKLDDLVAEVRRLDGEVGNGIRVPGKDATKEQWSAYRKSMGIPDAPEGYTLTRPQDLPNGLPYSEPLEKWFRQQLHKAGVSNEAAQSMFNEWNQLQSRTFVANQAAWQKADEESRTAAAKAAIETLTAEYKDALPQMMQLRDAAIARFGGQELVDAFRQARLPSGLTLDNDPRVSKMLIEVGKRMDVDTLVTGAGGSGNGNQPRPGLPTTPHGYALSFPDMEKDPRLRVKAE